MRSCCSDEDREWQIECLKSVHSMVWVCTNAVVAFSPDGSDVC